MPDKNLIYIYYRGKYLILNIEQVYIVVAKEITGLICLMEIKKKDLLGLFNRVIVETGINLKSLIFILISAGIELSFTPSNYVKRMAISAGKGRGWFVWWLLTPGWDRGYFYSTTSVGERRRKPQPKLSHSATASGLSPGRSSLFFFLYPLRSLASFPGFSTSFSFSTVS